MPSLSADAIRILIATDSHVGYNERDPIRGDDSWKSFHEVMCLAKDQDVDMVLLAGDLFHDNKPSRKSMYQVMRSLRMNCLGEKPCELEMLSDASEAFQGAFNHVNYEDPDINVAIPVFSIHGNHDDPSGEGHLCALDLLQISGLVNYYGRTPESDNIAIKPILFQKGHTKLALYGMSNVRDERLFRTFRDGRVKFFRPDTQQEDWFNLMAVHQNHHAYTETGYLPETFLPSFMDLLVWGHEHECLITPRLNPDTTFHVMQPGSSVATSLVPGEAVPKHVAVVTVNGRDFSTELHRLKTVRPFRIREVVLADEKGMKQLSKKDNNRSELTRFLEGVVKEMIAEANAEWVEAQGEAAGEDDDERQPPLPLIRLRVEYSSPEGGGTLECENPQRFSNRFVGKVANVNDVVQFYRKKSGATRKAANGSTLPEDSIMAQLSIDNVKVEKFVREFLTAQSLTILPQNSFGDAVSQFVDKDDKHAMEVFVNESLAGQIKHLMEVDQAEEDEDEGEDGIQGRITRYRSKLEELFAAGHLKKKRKTRLKPKPDNWDSDLDGEWADQPGALIHSDTEVINPEGDDDNEATAATRGRGRAARGGKTAAATSRKPAAKSTKSSATAKSRAATASRSSKKKAIEVDSDDGQDEDEDIVMIDDDDDDEDDSQSLFVKTPAPSRPAIRRTAAPKAMAAPTARRGGRQAALNFSQPSTSTQRTLRGNASSAGTQKAPTGQKGELSDDEIADVASEDDDDDEDAFEPAAATSSARPRPGRRGRR